MTDNQLGPRTVYYISKNGLHRPIIMNIGFFQQEIVDLGDEQVVQISGSISFNCDWTIKPITVSGQDKLQVIYRLMMVADTALRRLSEEYNLGIFKNIPGDIAEPMDVFR
jgi:hypothetical protein